MEVSSFELIYKPQSPVGAVDRVLQGYFLNITNLEDTQLFFRVDFVTSSVTDANRSLFNNTVAFIDTPSQNNNLATLDGGLASPSFRLNPNVIVPANGTAKIALLPSDPFPTMAAGPFPVPGPANFEARGHVTLRLPPLLFFGKFAVPQLAQPARVLLTPQNRATYLDSAGKINDQTQSSLPTASGAALAQVQPEVSLLTLPGLSDQLSAFTGELMPEYSEIDVAMMLASLEAAGADLKTLNAELKKAGIGIAVETRKE